MEMVAKGHGSHIAMCHADEAMHSRATPVLFTATQEELIQDHMKVERIMDEFVDGEDTKYLVKWTGLPYSEATWELKETLLNTENGVDGIDDYQVLNPLVPSQNVLCGVHIRIKLTPSCLSLRRQGKRGSSSRAGL